MALVPSLRGSAPSQRFRIEQWMPYLAQEGIDVHLVAFEDHALRRVTYERGHFGGKALAVARAAGRRLLALRDIRRYDAVLVHREAALVGPAVIEYLISRSGVPMLYDFDDPVWLPYRSPTSGRWARLKCPSKTAMICRHATVVIAGNRLLAGWARQHARHVEVIPSTIDVARHPLTAARSGDRPVRLGWTGSHSTLPFLEICRPALAELARRREFELVIISHTDALPVHSLAQRTIARKWSADTEVSDLDDVDIGLGPFPDSGWTPWRCHGKVLQYMAAGIPTVASAVGIVPDYVRNGVTGFLVESDADWAQHLEVLIDDAARRAQMGRSARMLLERNYDGSTWARRLAAIFRSATSGRYARA